MAICTMYQQWLQAHINNCILWIVVGAVILIVPIIGCIVEWKKKDEDLGLVLCLAAFPVFIGLIIVAANLISLINFISCPEGMLLDSILNMFS